MKKKVCLVSLVLGLALVGFVAVSAADVQTIGVLQLVEHPALDAAYQGFVDGLKEAGYVDGENIKIDFQNAQADQANLQTISDRFVKNKVDLILAIATPAGQAVAAATTDIPILVTAVTDLVGARLVESNEKPNTNVSGTSDASPMEKQVDLLLELFPDVKTVGIIYNSSEVNSQIQADQLEEILKAKDIKLERGTVTSVNDIDQVAASLITKVDALYAPTDNTIASAMANLGQIGIEKKMPIIAGEAGMIEQGGLATYGLNYYELGYQTGKMAALVLSGATVPANMPVETLEKADLVLNQIYADAIGYTFSDKLLSEAETIITK